MAGLEQQLSDFHFHTTHSDGSQTVTQAVKEAGERGITALAVTDHNNGAGVPELVELCQQEGIGCVEGVEIYAAFPLDAPWAWDPQFCGPVPDITILGRKLDWDVFRVAYQIPLMRYWATVWLPETLAKLREAGLIVPDLNEEQIALQLRDFGVPRVLHDVPNNPANWPRLLEICQSFNPDITAEDIQKMPVRWANRHLYAIGAPAYILRGPNDFGVEQAVELAKVMGGVCFAAHPGGEYGNWSSNHLSHFLKCGGQGIEAWQYFHTPEQIAGFLALAADQGLLVSGGSDWHGKNGRQTFGCWDRPEAQTPHWVFNQLLQRLPL